MRKQLKSILYLLALLSLSYIFIFYLPSKKNDEIVETNDNILTEKQTKNDYFERNLECLELKDNLEKKLENKKTSFGKLSLEEIFYSSKENSCLYVEHSFNGYFYNKRLLDILNDGYSSEPLEMCTAVYPSAEAVNYYKDDSASYYEDLTACDDFDKKVEEYKN